MNIFHRILCGASLLFVLNARAADNFADATELTGTFAQGTANSQTATVEPGEPVFAGGNAPRYGYRSLWWKWTAPANGRLSLSTKGSDVFNKYLTVVIGASVSTARVVTDILTNSSPTIDIADLPVTAGVTYHLAIGANNSGPYGTYSLTLSLETPGNLAGLNFSSPASVALDAFASRATLSGLTVSGIGYGNYAGEEPFEPVNAGQGTVWWNWTAPTTGTVNVTTQGSDPGAKKYLSVWTGTALPSLTPVVRSNFVTIPSVSFTSTAGQTYLFSVGTLFSFDHQYRTPGNVILTIAGQADGSQLIPLEIKKAVRLRWFAAAGTTYQLQSSTDMKFWSNAGDPAAGNDEYKEAYQMAEDPARFFRVVKQGP